MDDLLFKAAEAYKELMNYEYILIGGTSKRKIIISILSSDADKFTHVCGLDHLKDIPSVTAKKSREKEMIFKKYCTYLRYVNMRYVHFCYYFQAGV